MESAARVLVIEDDSVLGRVLLDILQQAGFEANHVVSAEEALLRLRSDPVDILLADLRLPGMGGLELLTQVATRWPEIPVVVLTAFGTVPEAVEAMRRGAADFLLKPFDRAHLIAVLEKSLSAAARCRPEPPPGSGAGDLLETPGLCEIMRVVRRVGGMPSTVLIRGESGTGKGLIAKALHDSSARRAHPFLKLQCAAFPDTLLESELFGYEKGAFTGATSRKPGRVELADRGTLFLDEIGEVAAPLQVKLLRLLEERSFERLGGTHARSVDVRIVAATHRPLESMMKQGLFREDLFYRLNVLPVHVPSLRERKADIEVLALRFLQELRVACERQEMRFSGCGLKALAEYHWPGNVRELRNVVERLVVIVDGDQIRAADVRVELGRCTDVASTKPPASGPTREELLSVLERTGGNRTLAARLLRISRRTLYNRLASYGMGGDTAGL